MPVVWLLILGTLPGDVMEFWSFLLAREIPPLNPLYYESILFFLLTIIPRFSLTVRRLHDSGKSGKWAKLPITTVTSGLFLIGCLFAALMTFSAGNGSEGLQTGIMVGVVAAMYVGSMVEFWDAMFGVAAMLNAIGWDAIWAMFSEIQTPTVDVGTGLSNFGENYKRAPGEGTMLILIMVFTVATPFVSALVHLYFMLLPSDRDENSFGQTSVKPITGAPKNKTTHNPMEGYAHLFARSPEEEAQLKERQKAELKALYRTRVLGQAKA